MSDLILAQFMNNGIAATFSLPASALKTPHLHILNKFLSIPVIGSLLLLSQTVRVYIS